MEKIKEYVANNLEKIAVLLILVGIGLIHFFVLDKLPFLSFYYLPVLLAAWGCGRRTALLVSMLSVFLVVLYAVAALSDFDHDIGNKIDQVKALHLKPGSEAKIDLLEKQISNEKFNIYFSLVTWSCFLILSAALVGTLYEQKEKKADELKEAYVGILEMLTKCLECTDRHVLGHSQRVAELAVEIARELKLPDDTIEKVKVGGLLHDIGKVDISLAALQKSAALTDRERQEISTHPLKGAAILQSVNVVLQDVIPIVRLHHERALNPEVKIPDLPQVRLNKELRLCVGTIAVADAYDAIVSDRPYRPGKLPWQAVQEIEAHSDTQFDSDVLDAFKKVISAKI